MDKQFLKVKADQYEPALVLIDDETIILVDGAKTGPTIMTLPKGQWEISEHFYERRGDWILTITPDPPE